ncbi:pilus assembly protein [Gilliamella sp. B14448G11]|uniref:TadE/TadG family type IV pilus assembly protein n=1 Tax=unclassified Gilliamella TaxID=2685620 RepID=UPI0018DC7FEE|nr:MULTISPECIES: TadE family protein [unclassified Gilliamella]MBI0029431.1 pilus assembly protein [Gilliamella sp. B14448G7]MBI0036405.1 pilus assembly protein [Gilliamella sp. B14448G11]MBI0043590.1 pilus assembly protein [Gilliamella sp. B14448G12]
MLKYWGLFFSQKNGVVSIQFAVIFPFLLILFLIAFEFSRVMIIGSALDLMTTEITRQAAITEQDDYAEKIEGLVQSEVPLWPYIANSNQINITVMYCKEVNNIIRDTCQTTLTDETHILLFDLRYQYSVVFSEFFSFLDTALTRKTVVYREFIKSEMEYKGNE